MADDYDTIVNQRASVIMRLKHWIAFMDLPEFSQLEVHQAKMRIERGRDIFAIKLQMPVQQHNVRNTWGSFDGTLLKWKDFRERFEAAIDKNDDIQPVYKLSYLKQSLQGQAAEVLAGKLMAQAIKELGNA